MADFPTTAVDYLHRVGRTGRLGTAGKATCVLRKGDVPLALAIQVCSAVCACVCVRVCACVLRMCFRFLYRMRCLIRSLPTPRT